MTNTDCSPVHPSLLSIIGEKLLALSPLVAVYSSQTLKLKVYIACIVFAWEDHKVYINYFNSTKLTVVQRIYHTVYNDLFLSIKHFMNFTDVYTTPIISP